jgi:hypothetical protein
MKIIYCADPLQDRHPDQAFDAEVAAAETVGLTYHVINYEALVDDNDPARAVRRVPVQSSSQLGIMRGWMLKPTDYQHLYESLGDRGIQLINNPAAYRHCHYLPEWYPLVKGYTPTSVWLEEHGDTSLDRLMALLHPLGPGPVIVKDFVKSRKHEWLEACYIPSAAEPGEVERVVRRFVELQGDDLNGGLVFRTFVEFQALTNHSRSGMPLTKEFRLFFLDGEPMFNAPYWEEGDYQNVQPPVEQFITVAQRIKSRFFTMDIAQRVDGDWMIIELGDGQVAGLPENADIPQFYRSLNQGLLPD